MTKVLWWKFCLNFRRETTWLQDVRVSTEIWVHWWLDACRLQFDQKTSNPKSVVMCHQLTNIGLESFRIVSETCVKNWDTQPWASMSLFSESIWQFVTHNYTIQFQHIAKDCWIAKIARSLERTDILLRLTQRDNLSNFVETSHEEQQMIWKKKCRNCLKRKAQAQKSFRKNHFHVNVQRYWIFFWCGK